MIVVVTVVVPLLVGGAVWVYSKQGWCKVER